MLVQGLLGQAGFHAGVYMVWRNPEGKESNLGHAVAVLRLEGRDYLVDPSEPEPFARHRGLFVATRMGYRFAKPVYAQDGAILGYRIGERVLAPGLIQPLPFAFVRSQFYYYRGEQAKGGLFRKPSTPEGLRRSLAMLERALDLDPANPLALYALGLVKAKLRLDARRDLERAYQLYLSYGHVPDGPKRALSLR